jgi:hypothetical protein
VSLLKITVDNTISYKSHNAKEKGGRMTLYRYSFLFFVLILFWPSILFGRNLDSKKMVPDQMIIEQSKRIAKSLGLNPIPVYIEEEGGDIIFTGGASLTIAGGQFSYNDNDMIINVGKLSVPVANFHLSTAEYAVVKAGRFVKQRDRILPNNTSDKLNFPDAVKPLMANKQKKYTGDKIVIDLHNTDLKNVFNILQNTSGMDFAVADDVEGTVTLSILNPTPWDQILDLLLEMKGLQKRELNDIIVITKKSDSKKASDFPDFNYESKDPLASINHLISEYGSKKVLYCVIGDYSSDNFSVRINNKLKKSPHSLEGISSDYIDAGTIWHDMKRFSMDIGNLEVQLKNEERKEKEKINKQIAETNKRRANEKSKSNKNQTYSQNKDNFKIKSIDIASYLDISVAKDRFGRVESVRVKCLRVDCGMPQFLYNLYATGTSLLSRQSSVSNSTVQIERGYTCEIYFTVFTKKNTSGLPCNPYRETACLMIEVDNDGNIDGYIKQDKERHKIETAINGNRLEIFAR